MFFYGTLKRGGRNHQPYCDGASFVTEASVRGDLYDIPHLDYPALVVPGGSIHEVGTADYAGDAEVQRRSVPPPAGLPEGVRAHGEIFAFDEPRACLPDLDRLEGFDPANALSPYRRVLLAAETGEDRLSLVWAYVVRQSSGVYLPEGVWPPGRGKAP